MSGHLSAQQIEEWIIGERSREMEEHLRTCQTCANEVEKLAGPLQLFGGAVRAWSGEMRPRTTPALVTGWARWRMAWVVAALLVMIVVPVYRHKELQREEAVVSEQDELLLRDVESHISRSVPAPMEPLARLMSNEGGRK